MRDLIMDPDVPPAALRISLLQILDGLGALDVQAKLGVSRATYYAGHRRAGQARGGEVGRTKAQGGIVLCRRGGHVRHRRQSPGGLWTSSSCTTSGTPR